MRICFVVPHYRHETLLPAVVERLRDFGLPIIIVDDGSPDDSFAQLLALAGEHDQIVLKRLAVNRGKGAAVIYGLREAERLGFTHAIQIDADGQHETDALPAFIAQAEADPDCLVSGAPQFGPDIPPSRLWGRKLTNFWIHVETLSRKVPDGMCGLRLYPVAAAVDLANNNRVGTRMDFDVEFLVRAIWKGWKVVFLPVHVSYGENGISHFDLFKDNVWISLMHTRLVIGMLLRLPLLIARKIFGDNQENQIDNSRIAAATMAEETRT